MLGSVTRINLRSIGAPHRGKSITIRCVRISNKKDWVLDMTEVELLVSLQANRAIFVDYVIVQTLMAAVEVYVAYMFRNFSQLL